MELLTGIAFASAGATVAYIAWREFNRWAVFKSREARIERYRRFLES